MSTPSVLLTRPQTQSDSFRARLHQEMRVVVSPTMRIELLDFSAEFQKFDALIFSSQNGVAAAARAGELSGLRAIAVGDKTASMAARHGMKVISAAGNSQDLIATVIADNSIKRCLFVRGRYSSGCVEVSLKNAGIDTVSIIGYDQKEMFLSPQALDMLAGEEPVVLPLFSPRSADLLGMQLRRQTVSSPIILVAISDAVIAAWTGPEPTERYVAQTPTANAMAKEILRLDPSWS